MSYRTYRNSLYGNTRDKYPGYGSVRTLQNTTLKFSSDGSRPGPAHQLFRGRGPAQPIVFSKLRGPAHDIGGEARETRALYGPAHVMSRTKR